MSKIYSGKALYPRRRAHSLRELLEMVANQYADIDAYIYRKKPQGQDYHVPYGQLLKDVEAFAAAIARQLPKLDKPVGEARIAVIGENSYPWVLSYNAACSYLGVAVPLDAQLPVDEAERLLERSEADILCFDSRHTDLARACLENETRVQLLISLDFDEKPQLPAGNLFTYEELLESGRQMSGEEQKRLLTYRPASEDLASIIFTSGTTAQSKGVLLRHRNIAINAHACAECFEVTPGDHALSVLPLHHTFENTVGMYTFWYLGLCICINDGLRYIGKNMKEWNVLCMMVVPAIAEKISDLIKRSITRQNLEKKFKTGRLIAKFLRFFGSDKRRLIFGDILNQLGGKFEFFVCGGAPLNPEVVNFYDTIGIDCIPGYGLSEASPVLACNVRGNSIADSVGWPLPGVSLMIDDSELADDGQGHQVGEVLALGDNIMLGYLDNPQASAEAMTEDGWLRTGDIAYFDKKGALHLTGRKKSMLVLSNGKKAFPEEIEGLLNSIPGVQESFVWAEESKRGNTIICAKLQITVHDLPKSVALDDEEISRYLYSEIQRINKSMPVYKAVTAFIWTEEPLEMTNTLKVRRPKERAAIAKHLAQADLSIQEASGMRLPSSPNGLDL